MTTTKKTSPMRGQGQIARATTMVIAIALSAGSPGCARDDRTHDEELALAIGHAIAQACPVGRLPSDEGARNNCADRLTSLGILQDAMREPFLWGGQKVAGNYSLEDGTSKFNARVWRRLYLSTFMFEDRPEVERIGELTVLHVPMRFRHALPAGAFPYPFWHSSGKWDSYSYSTTLHLIIRDGAAIGALRAADQNRSKSTTRHTWDGQWQWREGDAQMPYVSLYSYLFSGQNPHVARLDDAYRQLEAGMRAHHCPACHAPDNRGKARQLEFFVYPSQALSGRHNLVAQIEDDQMPPENDLGIEAGIADPAARADLIRLARAFEVAGDAALAWEGDEGIAGGAP